MDNAREKRLKEIKKELSELDLAIPGRIRIVSLRCGKRECVCWTKKSARHGPYYFWDRKVNGKVSTKIITKPMVPQLKKWIDNRYILEKLIQEVQELSQIIVADLVEEEKNKEKKM